MIVALIGLFASLFAYAIAFPYAHQRRLDLYLALLLLHLVATVAYWLFTFDSGVDAYTYYRDPYNFYALSPFDSGTYFIVHLTQTVKQTLGGSFLDHFFFFQCFGMIGIALLFRCFNEIAESLGSPMPPLVVAALFLPGLHFWSVAIGKDGLMIMAISLSLWGVMQMQRRWFWIVLALVVMSLVRPHVAAFSVFAIVCAVVFTNRFALWTKLLMIPVAVSGLIYTAFRAQELLKIGEGLGAISEFFETQQGYSEPYGSGVDTQSMIYPMKVFTLLFRPFFIDASGVMELVASFENALLLALFAYLVWSWRTVFHLMRKVPGIAYAVTFAAVLIAMLSLVNYNVGLGQRQKFMAVPALLVIYGAVFMYHRYQAMLAAVAVREAVEPSQQMPEGARLPA
jgi:hypothetical protein